jgi:hypothetical protein
VVRDWTCIVIHLEDAGNETGEKPTGSRGFFSRNKHVLSIHLQFTAEGFLRKPVPYT